MNWYDKEDAYARVFEQGRQARDLWRYIPDKLTDAVKDAFSDSDGYWIWLDHEEGGYIAYDGAEDCGMIHEYTIADLKRAIKSIRRREA